MRSMERMYMPQKRQKVYVAHEEVDFIWDIADVKEIEQYWDEEKSILEISENQNRKPLEVFLLVLDRLEKGCINPRKGGVWG
jgi:hypothetical protein